MESLFEKLSVALEKYKNAIIMSHKDPDLDALGSSMGLSLILTSLGKNPYIFLSSKNKKKYNTSVRLSLDRANDINYIYPSDYKKFVDGETVLIIVDVHQQERLEYPKILDELENIIVLDHHIKNNDYIRDTELFYIDSTLSSMVELVTNFAVFNRVNLRSVISSIMLAGMEIDTNGFNFKTNAKTFETAATLAEMGADTVLKQELLKESRDFYLRRADFVKNSYIVNKNIAMCMLPTTECSKEELASIAEELLKLEDIEASFAIGQLSEQEVGASARSVGNINVCDIMKQLGGGGHLNNAATQITDKTVLEVEQTIRKILGEE